ncbi:MAG: hypothetical protein QOI55_2171 [Actinomycetota bacterium]|jgi:hypothetical protein|nr:hypothetical protein [Actinomycetota bacterium]
MINFRFHIISLVAVFLALALGIFLGSAVGEPTIVNTLRNQIDSASKRSNALKSENGQLRSDNGRLQSFVNRTAAFAVQDRLATLDVAIVAERGVNRGAVNATRDLFRVARANVPIVIWLEQRIELANPDDVNAMATLLNSTATDAETLRRLVFTALARRLAAPLSTVSTNVPDVLRELVDAKFVSVDGLPKGELATFPIGRASAVVVDSAQGNIDDPTAFSQCVSAFTTHGVTTVAAEVGTSSTDPSAPARGDIISVIRSDSNLEGRVSTVDDLDLTEGRIATVLALQAANDSTKSTVGDYGYGRGAAAGPVPDPITK